MCQKCSSVVHNHCRRYTYEKRSKKIKIGKKKHKKSTILSGANSQVTELSSATGRYIYIYFNEFIYEACRVVFFFSFSFFNRLCDVLCLLYDAATLPELPLVGLIQFNKVT